MENRRQQGRRPSTLSLSLLALGLAVATSGCTIIENGEVGVTKSLGTISDEPLGAGAYFVVPVFRVIESWDVKLQEIKEQAAVPSSEGLIVVLDASLLFKVEPTKAPLLRKTVGLDYRNILVVPRLRKALRDIVAGYEVKNVYSETGRTEIAQRMEDYLREELTPRGITIDAVLLRDVQLPPSFRQSIEAKLAAEQKALQKRFELDQAKKDAEIEVARAKGAAEAQRIIQSTLSDAYLHYLWIQTLNENPNVVYVATESNLPIFKGVHTPKLPGAP